MPVRTRLLRSNRGQVVRLPKDVAFSAGVREVTILREAPRRVIVPADGVWDDFFDAPPVEFPEREQPAVEDPPTPG